MPTIAMKRKCARTWNSFNFEYLTRKCIGTGIQIIDDERTIPKYRTNCLFGFVCCFLANFNFFFFFFLSLRMIRFLISLVKLEENSSFVEQNGKFDERIVYLLLSKQIFLVFLLSIRSFHLDC